MLNYTECSRKPKKGPKTLHGKRAKDDMGLGRTIFSGKNCPVGLVGPVGPVGPVGRRSQFEFNRASNPYLGKNRTPVSHNAHLTSASPLLSLLFFPSFPTFLSFFPYFSFLLSLPFCSPSSTL
jgi:hypothetical protein